jgi:hypothetical protein
MIEAGYMPLIVLSFWEMLIFLVHGFDSRRQLHSKTGCVSKQGGFLLRRSAGWRRCWT